MPLVTSGLLNKTSSSKTELSGELLKQLQNDLLEMLIDFSTVCEAHGFYYSLCGGTALGAVRHGGFIPWDDDVDVFMYRKDIDSFIDAFQEELSEKYWLHSIETTPELGVPIMRLMKKGTVFVVGDTLDCPERGIFIDICILENAPDNAILRLIHGTGSLFFGLCVSCSRFYNKREFYREKYADASKNLRRTIEAKIFIGRLLSWKTLSWWTSAYGRWNALCKSDTTKDVVCPISTKRYFKEIFPREKYLTTICIQFEGVELQIIKEYDWALNKLYGDYMQIPPPEKREIHYVEEIKL